MFPSRLILSIALFLSLFNPLAAATKNTPDSNREQRLLYVATPGIRNYLDYGGHGIVVFDIDQNHRFVRRIKSAGLDDKGQPLNVKGICAHAESKRLYVSTIKTLMAFDLMSDQLLWEKSYEGGCDRMSITPDGKFIYLPSLEKNHWHVVAAKDGEVVKKIVPNSGAHNTIVGLQGKNAYLAGLKSPHLTVSDAQKHEVLKTVGPFSASIRPFTINHAETRCYVNVNELLGFEIGDLTTGRKLHRVEVEGFSKGTVKRHGCPSHGIGLTPDESEVWLCDGANSQVHIFDNRTLPPKQTVSIALRDQPGWVTFSLDGKYAYPSTGEVIDVARKEIVATLAGETNQAVHSEKMIEIHFKNGKPVRNGDQFGLGRAVPKETGKRRGSS